MSDDCCTDTGCSMDTAGDNGTCTDTVLSSDIDTTTSVETVILKHKIDSAVDDSISNHQSTSLNSPISTDDVGAQTISDGNSSQTQKSKRSKAANFWPCIRIVVFILIIIVLLLICKLKTIFVYEFVLKLFKYVVFYHIFRLYFRVQSEK